MTQYLRAAKRTNFPNITLFNNFPRSPSLSPQHTKFSQILFSVRYFHSYYSFPFGIYLIYFFYILCTLLSSIWIVILVKTFLALFFGSSLKSYKRKKEKERTFFLIISFSLGKVFFPLKKIKKREIFFLIA